MRHPPAMDLESVMVRAIRLKSDRAEGGRCGLMSIGILVHLMAVANIRATTEYQLVRSCGPRLIASMMCSSITDVTSAGGDAHGPPQPERPRRPLRAITARLGMCLHLLNSASGDGHHSRSLSLLHAVRYFVSRFVRLIRIDGRLARVKQ
jgi:hypothetical protein